MIYVRVWFSSRIKRDVPHYFNETNAIMMIWKFYAKLTCLHLCEHSGFISSILVNPVFPKYVLLSIIAFI